MSNSEASKEGAAPRPTSEVDKNEFETRVATMCAPSLKGKYLPKMKMKGNLNYVVPDSSSISLTLIFTATFSLRAPQRQTLHSKRRPHCKPSWCSSCEIVFPSRHKIDSRQACLQKQLSEVESRKCNNVSHTQTNVGMMTQQFHHLCQFVVSTLHEQLQNA